MNTDSVPQVSMGVSGRVRRCATLTAAIALRILLLGKRVGLMRIYALLPSPWRIRVKLFLYGVAGIPMSPLPVPSRYTRQHVRRRLSATEAERGINLLGYARGAFGLAENVRTHARVLERMQYPFDVIDFDLGVADRGQDPSLDKYFSDRMLYKRNLFFINADQMPIAYTSLGRKQLEPHLNIGYWEWELEKFPNEWCRSFDFVDEVWVSTDFVRRAVAACTRKPVVRIPKAIAVDAPIGMGRDYFGIPSDDYVFLFSYDFHSSAVRKNPEAVIKAFRSAFSDRSLQARLLVKSSNGARFPNELASLKHNVADDPRIDVRDDILTREEMTGLQNSVDCYVSLHRCEGFGLGLAECMYLGKPVIATAYSGNLDFMDKDNSLLVDYTLVPVGRGQYISWKGQVWADADTQHAAEFMRAMFDQRELAARIGASAAASIRRTNSYAACSSAIADRLQRLGSPTVARVAAAAT